MRIAVLGAGSISTPHLARYLAQRDDLVPTTIGLAGRTMDRLAAIARASRILAEGSRVTVDIAKAADGDWRQCLGGADVVLVQVRVGGYAARRYDETFPLEFDLCGDEGLGPGGLAAAWRTWPVLRDILRDAGSICPSAKVLLLTSPVSLLVRLARLEFPESNLAGICELPFTTLCRIAERRRVPWGELEWDYLGINHIGWLYGIGVADEGRTETVAMKYVRLDDAKQELLAEQRARPGGRAAELAALTPVVLDTYTRGGRGEIERALSMRPAEWYEAAVGPLIAGRAGGSDNMPYFLSVPQTSWHPAFEPDDVLEIPHLGHTMLPRSPRGPAPHVLVSRLLRHVRYERAASRAVAARDGQGIEEALALHPWVPRTVARPVLASRVCARVPSSASAR